tara:strand:+ start:483 stop:725 length:243 start_codon:yes stop_codon:yes gene_type:complete
MEPTYERYNALVDALMLAIDTKSETKSGILVRIAEQLAIGFTHEKVEEAKREALDLIELCEDVYKTQQYKDWIKSQEATQ